METVFTKILRRLHRMNILPSAVRAVYRMCSNQKILDMSTELAWEKVYSIAPRPQGTSYCEMPLNEEGGYDVSIIIPFYNTEAYAVQCIESVLSQVSDFRVETILVDDGSPDRCGEILDSYADRENVVVIHQKNQGVSAARNAGIVAARGEYVMFVDSDDYLAEGAVQALMVSARQHDADIVEGSHQNVAQDQTPQRVFYRKPGVGLCGAGMYGYPWGKVIRKTFFRNVCYPVGFWYEDCIIVNLIFPQAKTTVTVSDLIYFYRQNPSGQTSSTAGNPKSVHGLYVAEDVMRTFAKMGFECSGNRQRLLIMELGPHLMFHVQWMPEDDLKAVFIAACDLAERYRLLPKEHTGNYFYDEIIEALRNRQYDRWKWASVLV